MNNFEIVFIGIFIGVMTVIGVTAVSYNQKKRYFHEVDLDIAKIENELLESIREIGLSNLQGTPIGRELHSLLSEKELIALGDGTSISQKNVKDLEASKNSEVKETLTPYSHSLVMLVSAISSIASILIVWLSFRPALEYGWIIYPLLFFGLISSVFFALFVDNSFNMKKAGRYQRMVLSAFTGVIGAWFGLLFIVFLIPVVMYISIAKFLPTGSQKG